MKINDRSARGFDLMPALFAVLIAFVAVGAFEFAGSWPAAQRGLLNFEKACPIYAHSANHA
jgi:hypothetical protein